VLDRAHPNCVGLSKTPLHTLIASLALRSDSTLWGVVGCMGADGQPQIHAQTYVAMIDHGLDIQTSLSRRPRWLSGRFALGEARDTLHIEARFAGETIRRAGAPRACDRPLGRVERARGACAWDHDRCADGNAAWGE